MDAIEARSDAIEGHAANTTSRGIAESGSLVDFHELRTRHAGVSIGVNLAWRDKTSDPYRRRNDLQGTDTSARDQRQTPPQHPRQATLPQNLLDDLARIKIACSSCGRGQNRIAFGSSERSVFRLRFHLWPPLGRPPRYANIHPDQARRHGNSMHGSPYRSILRQNLHSRYISAFGLAKKHRTSLSQRLSRPFCSPLAASPDVARGRRQGTDSTHLGHDGSRFFSRAAPHISDL